MKPEITIEDFMKLDLRVGLVETAELVEGSEKLLRLQVRFGEGDEDQAVRTIFAGIRKWYQPEDLVGKKFGFVYNLTPRKMMGSESQGMMLAVSDGEAAMIWPVPEEAAVGSVIR